MNWEKIETVLNEMAEMQSKLLLREAQSIIPHLTSDDILQPNDFPELENHPHFRYEEGILAGILSARMAILAVKTEAL